MPVGRTISNPFGAFNPVSSYITGLFADGSDLDFDADYIVLRANATITKGQAVGLVLPTATVPPSATPQTAAMAKRLYLGAAQNAANVGQSVQITTKGFALVNVGAGTPAAGDLLVVPATTTGVFDTTAAAPDATTIVGTLAGTVLGAKNASNLAFAWVNNN